MAPHHHLLPQPPPLRPASNSSSIAAPDADQDSGHVLPNLPNLPNLPGMPGADVLAEQFKKFYSSSYYASLQQAAAVVAATANVANGGGAGAAAAAAAAAAIDPMSTFADAEDDGELDQCKIGLWIDPHSCGGAFLKKSYVVLCRFLKIRNHESQFYLA